MTTNDFLINARNFIALNNKTNFPIFKSEYKNNAKIKSNFQSRLMPKLRCQRSPPPSPRQHTDVRSGHRMRVEVTARSA